MIRVSKGDTGEFVLMEAFEFQKNCSILRDEIGRLRSVQQAHVLIVLMCCFRFAQYLVVVGYSAQSTV